MPLLLLQQPASQQPPRAAAQITQPRFDKRGRRDLLLQLEQLEFPFWQRSRAGQPGMLPLLRGCCHIARSGFRTAMTAQHTCSEISTRLSGGRETKQAKLGTIWRSVVDTRVENRPGAACGGALNVSATFAAWFAAGRERDSRARVL